jgi:hypothetical protein
MDNAFDWLKGTYWYVPRAFLPALQFDPQSGKSNLVIDQTVWNFLESRDGYVWGNCYVMLGTAAEGMQFNAPRYIVGSVTPWDGVQFRFVQQGSNAASPTSVTGFGQIVQRDEKWVFQMQMVSGLGDVTVHWAEMWQTQPGEPSWENLPGTGGMSMEEFLANF